MRLILISCCLIFCTYQVNAGIFGPNNFEECMVDGKVGRTRVEIALLRVSCRKRFPALPSLAANKSTKLFCTYESLQFPLSLNTQNKTATLNNGREGQITSITLTKVISTFGEPAEFSISVDYMDGALEFQFKKDATPSYGRCEEEK